MRARTSRGLVGLLVSGWLVAACAGSQGPGAGWTFGPTGAPGPTAAAPSGSPDASASAPAVPSPTTDVRPSLLYPDVQSHGVVTVAFSRPALPSLDLDLVCEWVSPAEVGYFYVAPSSRSIAGEQVYFEVQPRSPGYQFWIGRKGAASYQPGPTTGNVALSEIGQGWVSGSMWFDGLSPDPKTGPGSGPLPVPIEEWVRPLGGDPALKHLSGTVTWACEPAPATVPSPGQVASEEPGHTFPPFPRLTLVGGEVRRQAVSGCGASIDIGGYTAADSCGPSFQALGVDYIVRIPEGGRLRFELPTGWRFVSWSLGRVSQIDAERWRGEQPASFETVQTGDATDGPILQLDAPPKGDWSVRLDWRGASGSDSFGVPDYFRVLVED